MTEKKDSAEIIDVKALLAGVETHENWLEVHRYLNMDYLRGLKTDAVRKAA